MPAAVRGASKAKAKPSSKTPPQAAPRPAPSRRAPAEARGLSPRLALVCAGGVLALALGVTLAPGHRGPRLVAAIGSGIDNRLGAAGFRLETIAVQGGSPGGAGDLLQG